MNEYQEEQLSCLLTVLKHLSALSEAERQQLRSTLSQYLDFRLRTEKFLSDHFGRICTRKCYESRLSACCSKDGIITFFADVVINALLSDIREVDALKKVLKSPHMGLKCVYLGERGCMWRLKPIVCEMFLCEQAKNEVFFRFPSCEKNWHQLLEEKKTYTWPDAPVLFDTLEQYFLDAGCDSPLMYLHKSPGLLMVKKKSRGLIAQKKGNNTL